MGFYLNYVECKFVLIHLAYAEALCFISTMWNVNSAINDQLALIQAVLSQLCGM